VRATALHARLATAARGLAMATAPLVLALVAVALALVALERDPAAFFENLLWRGVLSRLGIEDTITRMAPLLLLAASLIAAFRAGLWNLGIDGQFVLAAVLVAACGAELVRYAPGWLALVVLAALAAAVGAAWALVPALLRAYYGVNEIITTLMMTFIGTSLSSLLVKTAFSDPAITVPQTRTIPVDDRLPHLFGTAVHSGVLVGVVLILAVHLLMTRSAFGLRLQVIGRNPRAARHAGLDVPRLTIAAFALSGGLAGLAGGIEILGVFGHVQNEWNPRYGFWIVPLVFLARLNGAWAIALVAVFAMLSIGGESASRRADLPDYFVTLFVALVLLFIAVTEYIDRRGLARRA
jgi:simple sugar transport system permease protein